MKHIIAHVSMLKRHESQHKKPLKCLRCGHVIKAGERVARTAHRHYYCNECTDVIEVSA